VPGFTRDPARLLEAIEALLRGCHDRPVLFPTADPDLGTCCGDRPANRLLAVNRARRIKPTMTPKQQGQGDAI